MEVEELPSSKKKTGEIFEFPSQHTFLYQHVLPMDSAGDQPISIDAGSYAFRCGWAGDPEPYVNTHNVIYLNKNRKENERKIFIGDSVVEEWRHRLVFKSPFSGPLLRDQEAFESMFDYAFSSLGINADKVNSRIIMTEPILNPVYCRSLASELLFECYQTPSVCYGIDSLFSLYYNQVENPALKLAGEEPPKKGKAALMSSLIINVGAYTIHVIPVLHGKAQYSNSIRINLGGETCSEYMRNFIQMAYPQHRAEITQWRIKYLKENICYTPLNYLEELKKYCMEDEKANEQSEKENTDQVAPIAKVPNSENTLENCTNINKEEFVRTTGVIKFQLPVPKFASNPQQSQQEIEEKLKKRVEQGRRLAEAQSKKREEEKKREREELQMMDSMFEEFQSDPKMLKKRCIEIGYASVSQMKEERDRIRLKIKRSAQATGVGEAGEGDGTSKNESVADADSSGEPPRATADSSLPSDLSASADNPSNNKLAASNSSSNLKIRIKFAAKDIAGSSSGGNGAEPNKNEVNPMEVDNGENLTEEEMKKQRKQNIIQMMKEGREEKRREREEEKRKEEEKKKLEQERIQNDPVGYVNELHNERKEILEQLEKRRKEETSVGSRRSGATNERFRVMTKQTQSGDDNFGVDDKDWDVYLLMNSETRKEETEKFEVMLEAVEAKLAAYDPSFNKNNEESTSMEDTYQMGIGVDRIRTSEIFFQPSIIGIDQAGLVECIQIVLDRYNELDRTEMLKNIFVTGGGGLFPGFIERIKAEITMLVPTKLLFDVRRESSTLDAWKGAGLFGSSKSFLDKYSVTKSMYDEFGGGYIIDHFCGNATK